MIEIRSLYKYFGQHRAVGPINATIKDGEIVGLLGLNGAGKSTTMRMLACDLLPSAGTVLVQGLDVSEHPRQVRQRVGYLPDTPPVYPEMRVGEFLRFVARLRGVEANELRGFVQRAEERTGIAEADRQLIGTLSHGYRQRVGIAQAIVHDPPLILLDEPISGLDPEQIVSTREMIRSLGGDHTVLLSSHILSEISETCDHLLVIRDGEIVASGTETELFASVGERTLIHLQVRHAGQSLDALRALLTGIPHVEQVQESTIEPASNLLDVQLVASRDARTTVARSVVEAGFELLTLTRAERELESIFLQIAAPETNKSASGQKASRAAKTKQQEAREP